MSGTPALPRLVNFSDSDMSTESDSDEPVIISTSRSDSNCQESVDARKTDDCNAIPHSSNEKDLQNLSDVKVGDHLRSKTGARRSSERSSPSKFRRSRSWGRRRSYSKGKSSSRERSRSRGRSRSSYRSRSHGRSRSRGRRSLSRGRSFSGGRYSRGRSRSSGSCDGSGSRGRRSVSRGRRSRSRGRRSGSRSRRSGSRNRRSGSRNRRSGSRNRRSGSRSRRSGSRGGRRRRTRSRSKERRRRSRSTSRGRYRRSRSRSHGRHRRSRSGSRRRRRYSSPRRSRHISPPSYRTLEKLDTLEKLGIELKPAPPPPEEEPQAPLPSYYNRLAVNPAKYAQQMAKRKLIWGHKTSDEGSSKPSTWQGTTFSQDQDGKMTAKFKRLMGIKEDGSSETSTGSKGQEIIKRQQELFSSMEIQYEAARQATHTQRGVGLGFSSHPHHFP